MDPERWERLQELVEAAIKLDAEQRGRYLDLACGGDAALRRQAESLILASQDETVTFKGPVQDLDDRGFVESAAIGLGQHIGPYRIVQELGRGGMGAVYLAMRADDEYKKRVAIKIVKHGAADQEMVRRFLNERQILASLDHPNIARLLDGGRTTNGLPYVVMDYIEGLSIDKYCDRHRLRIDERLRLFRSVCSAVHYAHQNLVIHRDIKPGNILVTSEGVPKLLDFGIAKLLNPELGPRTQAVTGIAMRLMTPEYASPEQVRGEPITTASDIYSLGVVLYELLTGHRPYQFKSHLVQDIERVISQEEPERPSTVISRRDEVPGPDATASNVLTPETVSRDRGEAPEKLRRRLTGELDDIVMMALRKEPQRRYGSVEQFSDDVRRHLEGLPVMARPDTLTYRASKFINRYKTAVASAILILLTLLGGIIATTLQARVAERRFNEVRQLAHSFMFEIHDAIATLPGSTPARELLVKRALEYLDRLAQEAGSDPSLQGELAAAYDKVGDVQGSPHVPNLGDTTGALESYRKALTIREALVARAPGDLELRRKLAISFDNVGDMHSQIGDTAGALKNYRQALSVFEALASQHPDDMKIRRDLAVSYGRVATTLAATGDLAAALETARKGLTIRQALSAADPGNKQTRRTLAVSYAITGDLFQSKGDMAAAEEHYQQAVTIFEELAAHDTTNARARRDLSNGYMAMGDIHISAGKPDLALDRYQKAWSLTQALSEADPTNAQALQDLANSLTSVGDALGNPNLPNLGDANGALEHYRKAQTIYEKLIASDSANARARRDLSLVLMRIGSVLAANGNPTQSLGPLQQALALREVLAANDPQNAVYQSDLATIFMRLGQVHATLGSIGGQSASSRTDHWRQARSWFQKSLGLWNDRRQRGIVDKSDSGKIDELNKNIARCDEALAKSTASKK